jgi:hypothetical protein
LIAVQNTFDGRHGARFTLRANNCCSVRIRANNREQTTVFLVNINEGKENP